MRKFTGMRRLVSVAVSVALLFSLMAVADVSATASVWGFETDALGENLSLSTTYTAVPTDAVHYSGTRALQLNGGKKSAALRPQVMLKNGSGEAVTVVEGGEYSVSFYVMLPEDAPDNRILYWLTATNSTTAYATTDEKDAELFYDSNGAVKVTPLGSWKKIEINNVVATRSGQLRLGISINSNTAHVLYVDDVEVVCHSAPTPTPTPTPTTPEWSFEADTLGQNLSLSDTYTAVPTDAVHYSGTRALQLNGGKKSAALRPQVMLKNGSGEAVTVEAGKEYSVSFYVMLPEDAPDNRILYWLTATDSTAAYTTTDEKDAELFYDSNGAVKVTPLGSWKKIEINNVVATRSGQLRLGISINSNTAHVLYIDDVLVVCHSTPAPTPGTPEWGFEADTLGQNLSLSDTYPAVPTDTVAYNGAHSLALSGGKKSAAKRPQVMLKNGSGEAVTVTKDKTYDVSFYVMLPADAPDNRLLYWLTATDSTAAYTATDEKDAELFYEPASYITVTALGEWQQVVISNVTAPRSGQLRLGISINSNADQTLYVDDVLVEEKTATAPPVRVEGSWSFEDEATGTVLDLNSNKCVIEVADEITAFNGAHVAKVTSVSKSGNARPQLTVKDPAGNGIHVYKGRSYAFTFQVFIPVDANEYDFSYWLAATPDEEPFGTGYSKDSYVVAEVSEGTQPTPGQWNEISMQIADCPYSGLLRFGLTGAISEQHSFYIDDLTVTETVLDYDVDAQSFEIYTEGDKLSLGTDATITATTEDAHAGEYAAKVVTAGNSVDGAPQMLVTDAAGEPITVKQGDKYNVSFYVCVPTGTVDTDVQYWLTAGDDTPFTDSTPRTGIIVDTQTVAVTDKGSWQYVLVAIDDCVATGKLRLGITGTAAEAITLYLDDILVKERQAGPTDTEAMNFENYTVGENLSLAKTATETMTVTNLQSYTGLQSIHVKSTSRAGDLRPQLMVKDGDGNQVKLEKGEDYYLHFMVYIPEGQSYFDLSYWAACVPDDKVGDPFVKDSDFLKNDYVVAEVSQMLSPTLGEWVKIVLPITDCKHGGNLRLGITHHTQGVKSQMYVDDIKIVPPQYVQVKFDTNGSKDVYEDLVVLADSLIPYSGIDPYLEGYEFMGWYTSEEFKREQYFDIATTPVTGVTGDVLTLYARWRQWDKVVVDLSDREEPEQEYETKYYTEKVWVGDQNVPDPLDLGDRPGHKEAAPIVDTPDADVPVTEDGLPPWLLVVIIGGAVLVIGGGAAVAAVLLKKKSNKET